MKFFLLFETISQRSTVKRFRICCQTKAPGPSVTPLLRTRAAVPARSRPADSKLTCSQNPSSTGARGQCPERDLQTSCTAASSTQTHRGEPQPGRREAKTQSHQTHSDHSQEGPRVLCKACLLSPEPSHSLLPHTHCLDQGWAFPPGINPFTPAAPPALGGARMQWDQWTDGKHITRVTVSGQRQDLWFCRGLGPASRCISVFVNNY